MVLRPEYRCSSFLGKCFESVFKPRFKNFNYWCCVSGTHLPFKYILNEGPHVTYLLLSEFVFHDVLIDGCIYMEVSLVKTPSVSFKLLKSQQTKYYFEVQAIYNDCI